MRRVPPSVIAREELDRLLAEGVEEGENIGSEAELLEVARSESLKTLKERARKCRLEAFDPEELHARQHQARFRELAPDAFLKAVLHDGVRIDTVAHFGRHIKAELRTALELGAPPDFDGVSCTEAGCDRRYRLEWDHVNPRANRGRTSYENLKPRCWPHHQEKTERDRRAGLLQAAGQGPDPP